MTQGLSARTSTVPPRGERLADGYHARLLTIVRTGLLALASVAILGAFSAHAGAATVTTDEPDYSPGQTVIIAGSGWEPGETVNLVLQEDPAIDPDLQLTAVADANGDILNTDFIVDVFDIGVSFTLTATGTSSG